MSRITKLFPEGKRKAFTLSYDDGVIQDKKLVEIFNRHDLKATFNLNSGLQGEEGTCVIRDLVIERIKDNEMIDLYKGMKLLFMD